MFFAWLFLEKNASTSFEDLSNILRSFRFSNRFCVYLAFFDVFLTLFV